MLAADMIATRLAQIQEDIDSYKPEYVVVDTPGQTELFAFRESGEYIVKESKADFKVLLFLLDPFLGNTPVNYLSMVLLSASVGLRMNVPRISVLTKRDIAKEEVKQILEWSKNSAAFESALASTRDSDLYVLHSDLFRSLRKLSFGADVYPISSVTQEGMIALVGEIARLGRGGEELSD